MKQKHLAIKMPQKADGTDVLFRIVNKKTKVIIERKGREGEGEGEGVLWMVDVWRRGGKNGSQKKIVCLSYFL